MNIKHLALVVMTAICAMGQLCAPPEPYPVEDYAGRLELNDTLREACPSLSNADILDTIVIMETDRLAGFSPSEEFASVVNVCSTQECVVCVSAIIDQVYGLNP